MSIVEFTGHHLGFLMRAKLERVMSVGSGGGVILSGLSGGIGAGGMLYL